jgi:hypothetical protein
MSSITDFNGVIGGSQTRGTANNDAYSFDCDMRFMRGVYVGLDGRMRNASMIRRLAALPAVGAVSLCLTAPVQAAVTPKPGYYAGFSGAYPLAFKVSANGRNVTGFSSDWLPGADGCNPGVGEGGFATIGPMSISDGAVHESDPSNGFRSEASSRTPPR